MPDLRGSRRKLKIAIVVLLAADAVAAAVLFSPLAGSAESRHELMSRLSTELRAKTKEVEPLRNIDKKVDMAKQQIPQFYRDRFAAHDSDVAAQLGKLAQESGVRIMQAKYKEGDPETAGTVPVAVEATLSGDYLQLVRFVNALERSKLFYIVDSINLAGENAGPVKLDVKLHSYLRGA